MSRLFKGFKRKKKYFFFFNQKKPPNFNFDEIYYKALSFNAVTPLNLIIFI